MTGQRKLTKNEKKRLKAKDKKSKENTVDDDQKKSQAQPDEDIYDGVDVEYVSVNPLEILEDQNIIQQFQSVFSKFVKAEVLLSESPKDGVVESKESVDKKEDKLVSAEIEIENKPVKLSKKKKKLLSRLSVAELKQLVNRPDVVEAHDVTSSDPRFLVYLKAYRNCVPVPRHWCAIRKYLQGKRGIEKPPFQLPDFIAETGIAKIRDTLLEQEAERKAKQKNRERLQPKMGKIDIDYQVLHDAFFKYQTKPKMTRHGDLYYEGKEFEVHIKEKTPGILSNELKSALGITDSVPPPWLINMQRYGPPPSYPSMRIAGLNAPIPPGCQFGYQPGQWGKPPVDEYGRPLYGDVFGTMSAEIDTQAEAVDKVTKWGELLVTEPQEESDEEEEEDEEQITSTEQHLKQRDRLRMGIVSGTETPMTDGISSVQTGLTTPDVIDLRKRAVGGLETPDTVYGAGASRELYQVIKEKAVTGTTGQLFGSDRTYILPGTQKAEMTTSQGEEEDGHDGDEGDENKGKRKRRLDSSTVTKRYKDFKF